MYIAIVDDDKEFQTQLQKLLERLAEEWQLPLSTDCFDSGEEFLFEYEPKWDLVFMDIRLKDMDGMEAAARMREKDEQVLLVFITSMAQYAIKGYEVDAADYILKPLEYAEFSRKMHRIVKLLNRRREKHYLLLEREGTKERVCTEDIWYVEVQNHKVFYVTKEYVYEQRSSMLEAARRLESCSFARCNQSYLVNLAHVTGIEKDFVLVHQKRVPFSRARRKDFLAAVSDYLEGGH